MVATTAPTPAHVRLVRARDLSTLPVDLTEEASSELSVCIGAPFWARYKGSRAQLEAEGVIPAGIKWPAGGRGICWRDGNLDFTLHRVRPDGMKGPMKLWLEGDHWSLDIAVSNRGEDWVLRRDIDEKAKVLAAAVRENSPAGRLEWDVQRGRYGKALGDTAFQAFKSRFIPARKKPGRPPRGRAEDSTCGGQTT